MAACLCSKCGAELAPGGNFCRRCGNPVEVLADPSEQQTAILNQVTPNPTTQRLDSRPTSGAPNPIPPAGLGTPGAAPVIHNSRSASKSALVLGAIVFVIVFAIGGTFVVMKRMNRPRAHTQVSTQLNYPGARTTVDVAGEDGGRVLQMETTDSFEKVAAWYESNLKPIKTIRATSTTVIMRNNNITATIVGTTEGASIVIKQAPR